MSTPQNQITSPNDDEYESDYASGYTPTEFLSDSDSDTDDNFETNLKTNSIFAPFKGFLQSESEFDGESDEESDYASGYTPSDASEAAGYSFETSSPTSDVAPEHNEGEVASEGNPEIEIIYRSDPSVLTARANAAAKGKGKRLASSSPPASLTALDGPSTEHMRKRARTHSPGQDVDDEHVVDARFDDKDYEGDDDEESKQDEEQDEAQEEVAPRPTSHRSLQPYVQDEEVEEENDGFDARTHTVPPTRDKGKHRALDPEEYTALIATGLAAQRSHSPPSRQPKPIFTNPSRDAPDIPADISTGLSTYQAQLTIPDTIATKYSLSSACTEAQSLFGAPKTPFAPSRPNFSLLKAMCSRPEIILCLVSWLSLDSLLDVYAIDRRFHWLMNSHYTTFMKACLRLNAPFAVAVFPWRWYARLTICDPASRLRDEYQARMLALGMTVSEAQDAAGITDFRRVPGFRYAKMVVHRHNVVSDIVTELRGRGLKLPPGSFEAMLKCWFTMDIPGNGTRIGLMHHRPYWTDEDLWNVAHFFMKFDMACCDPVESQGERALSRLFLGMRHLTEVRNLLRGDYSWVQIVQRKVYYDYVPRVEHGHLPIFGIPPGHVGRGCMENWGRGNSNVRLLRVDELVLKEMFRRNMLEANHKFVDLMMYGFWPELDWLEANWTWVSKKIKRKQILGKLERKQMEVRESMKKEALVKEFKELYLQPVVEGMD